MEKKRHGCLAVYLVFLMITGALGAITWIFAGDFAAVSNPEVPENLRLLFGIGNVLIVVSAIALWKWQKWGFWLFVANGACIVILRISLLGSISPLLVGLLGMGIMYGILHIGQERQGWKQLD